MKLGIVVSADIRKKLYGAVLVSMRQIDAFNRLCRIFCENEIDYMPLKGCVLKELYPSDELRSMGDIDILIRTEQYGRIRSLMLAEGFQEGAESDHEYHWSSSSAHIELHKRLIPSYTTMTTVGN